MSMLVDSLLIRLYPKSLGKRCPVDSVMLPLEHELYELLIVVHVKCSIEYSDHRWIIVPTTLKK